MKAWFRKWLGSAGETELEEHMHNLTVENAEARERMERRVRVVEIRLDALRRQQEQIEKSG